MGRTSDRVNFFYPQFRSDKSLLEEAASRLCLMLSSNVDTKVSDYVPDANGGLVKGRHWNFLPVVHDPNSPPYPSLARLHGFLPKCNFFCLVRIAGDRSGRFRVSAILQTFV